MSATERTEHYQLPIYKADDKLDILVDCNGAMRTIDNTLYDIATQVNTDGENIVSVSTLAENNKNRVDANETAIGALDGRQTATETSLTNMINSYNVLSNRVDNIDSSVDTITQTANTAVNKADNAQTTANTAVSKADTATATANTAKSTAESASSSASSASSAADDAMAQAIVAKNAADTAATNAENARTIAISTKNKVDNIIYPMIGIGGKNYSVVTGTSRTGTSTSEGIKTETDWNISVQGLYQFKLSIEPLGTYAEAGSLWDIILIPKIYLANNTSMPIATYSRMARYNEGDDDGTLDLYTPILPLAFEDSYNFDFDIVAFYNAPSQRVEATFRYTLTLLKWVHD